MRRLFLPLLVMALAAATPARAGPPYVTDDPEPTDRGHWEVYGFANASHTPGDTAGETGLDLNYGAASDLQITLVLPAAYDLADGTHASGGVIEAAAKLKILHQDPHGWRPGVAIFPRLFQPTSGGGRLNLLVPVWAGKDFGPWSLFGGGGYQFNPGPGQRDFWTGGLALSRTLSDRLSVGGEIYGRGRDAVDGKPFSGLNLGVTWRLNEHWSLLAAGGPGVRNPRDEGQYDAYVALKADY